MQKPFSNGAHLRAYVMAALLALVTCFAFAPHASAHARHHRHWHHGHHHRNWRRHHWHGRLHFSQRTPEAAPFIFRPPAQVMTTFARSVSDVARVAQEFIGRRNFTTHRGIPWCASAVNAWLDMTGHRHVRSLRAIDALGDGPHVRRPEIGDLAVMRHHVTVFLGWGGRGFLAIGGNQGRAHRVTVASYPTYRVLAWVRPI